MGSYSLYFSNLAMILMFQFMWVNIINIGRMYYYQYTPIDQLGGHFLESELPVRESQVIQGVHFERNPVIAQQTHYVRLPVRFTYSTSPSASQTRPLEVRGNQIQSQVFQHVQQPGAGGSYSRREGVVKRHKIFGEERRQNDFTPRRRIYVESKQYSSPVFEEEKVLQRGREHEKQEEKVEIDQPQDELNKSFEVENHEDYIQINKQSQPDDLDSNNTYQQIKDSLAEITQKPLKMVDNKSTKSHNVNLQNDLRQDLNYDEIISVQLQDLKSRPVTQNWQQKQKQKSRKRDIEIDIDLDIEENIIRQNEIRKSFGGIQESPVNAPPFPIPLEQQEIMMFVSPLDNSHCINRHLDFSSILKPVLHEQKQEPINRFNRPYYFHKIVLVLTFCYFVFQVIK